MYRLIKVLLIVIFVSILTGCAELQPDEPIWENTKIGDLAPALQPELSVEKDSSGQKVYSFEMPEKPQNLNQPSADMAVLVFETPAENIDKLIAAYDSLEKRQIRLNCPAAFKDNAFYAGFGSGLMWDAIGETLRATNSKKIKTVTLYLEKNYTEKVTAVILPKKQSVFYIGCDSRMDGLDLEQGKLVIEVKASALPDVRGVAKMDIQPAWIPFIQLNLPGMQGTCSKDVLFLSTGLSLTMSPGDFVFIAPTEYRNERASLSGLFFSRPGKKPAVRTYLVVCRGLGG